MSAAPELVQLKIRLTGISPMIWRRVLVPVSTTLHELPGIFQVAMGWEGVHLFLFDIYAVRYGSFELHAANPDVPLLEFDFSVNERFSCIHDMGDHWEHEIRVEAIHPPRKKFYESIKKLGVCSPDVSPTSETQRVFLTILGSMKPPAFSCSPIRPGCRDAGSTSGRHPAGDVQHARGDARADAPWTCDVVSVLRQGAP